MSIHEPRTVVSPDPDTAAADGSALRERVLSLRLPQKQSPPGVGAGKAAWALVVVLAAVICVLVYFLMQKSPAEAPTTIIQAKASGDPPTASSGDIALDSKGYIMPVQRILVSPQVSGRIVKLDILEGRHVNKGDVLAVLEDDDYKDDLAHAESALQSAQQRLDELKAMFPQEIGQAKADLEMAKAEMVQLKADCNRATDLYRKQKAISELDYDLAQSKSQSADQHVHSLESALRLLENSRGNRIAAAEADVRQATADRNKAQLHLDWCKIRAPISGTILEEECRGGQSRQPDRHERLVQPLRPGRPFRPGGGTDHPGARH